MPDLIPLRDLRPGAVFVTEAGVLAMKTAYHSFGYSAQCECYLLASGEAALFPDGNSELVREIKVHNP